MDIRNYCALFSLLLLLTSCLIELTDAHKSILDLPSTCPVYLTISPLGKNAENSFLEINWGPACENPPEWIGIYDSYPSADDVRLNAFVHTYNNQSGSILTNVKVGKFSLPSAWQRYTSIETNQIKIDKDKCLPYFAASYIGKNLQTLTCLMVEPLWMRSIDHLSSIPLKNIFIPGTHCSGCYYSKAGGRKTLMQKFGFTQNFDVWTQLVLGVRYLDFSVGYQESSKNHHNVSRHFWVVNEGIFITPLPHIFEDIRNFVKLTNETVIIDFHDFPLGFYNQPERHVEFINLLERELGDIAFRRTLKDSIEQSFDLTLGDIMQSGKTLLISYNYPEMVTKDHDFIWPSWQRFTTKNVRTIELQEYMRKLFTGKYEGNSQSSGWVFVGIQGVESSYNDGKGLPTSRERANEINKILNVKLGGPWSLKANVVMLDFLTSTNLIDICIHTNRHKSFENNENHLIHFDIQE